MAVDHVVCEAVQRAQRDSPFLAIVLEREPALAAAFAAGVLPPLTGLAADLDDDPDAMPVARRLRLTRRRLALRVAIGDLAGVDDLSTVMHALSDFADQALHDAILTAIAERTPGAAPIGFAAIALGKQGSRELNYSSDIDPILIFDPTTLPCRRGEVPEVAAVRIARRVVELLQARDGDGYVLRVDLRLRPSPEVTPIALSVDAAISYYESLALPWERAAFIRARAAAGDRALGERFLGAIAPFIWRRALDFGAIGEIRGISRRIRDHYAQGQAFGPGFDLKRGRGGIREVEFFTQIHQLIHGGRDPALRVPATRDALAALAAAGWVDAEEAVALTQAYTLFRTIEHRVQMIEDRQTHALPHGAALDGVARLHGLADGGDLLALLAPPVAATARTYDGLDPDVGDALSFDPDVLGGQLAKAGFGDAAIAVQRIEQWRSGSYPALRSPAARAALEAVLPGLIEALGGAPDPHGAIVRLDRMLARLSSAVNFFRLLEARPALARLLGLILSHAVTLAEDLAGRPELLDGLIDASALDPVADVAVLMTEMDAGSDFQAKLDHVRRVVGEKRFALGTQIVAGVADPLDVSAGYARVAEAAIGVLARATVAEFAAVHGVVPDSELVILALGRLGGRALTHASDLDLIYLFTGNYLAESNGRKPLGAVLYYNRLAQRLSAALSVPTASGPLYEIDTRLRPSGTQGPLTVSLDGFAQYQREQAWTWEHMALTRARPVFGSADAREAVDAIIRDVLLGNRPPRDIVADATAMRRDVAKHKPPLGPLDAKLLPGGLVDLEFAVHIVQLTRHIGLHPNLHRAISALIGEGAAPQTMAAAYDLLARLLVTLRLVAPTADHPGAATQGLIAQALRMADWGQVIASLETSRQDVATWLAQVEGNGA